MNSEITPSETIRVVRTTGGGPHWKAYHQAEIIIGKLLRWGVLVSSLIVLAGGTFYLCQFGNQLPHHTVFRSEPADLRNLSGILRETVRGDSRGIIQLGLLLLIATPVARVAFSIYAFARIRDWLYVGITAIVLAALALSLYSV